MNAVSPLKPIAEPPLRSVAQWEVHLYWERMLPLLSRVIGVPGADISLADAHHFLITGAMQAWHDPDWALLAVTQIQSFGANLQLPTKRVCAVIFCAGELLDEDTAQEGVDFLDAWAARVYGTSSIRLMGRPGWTKKLRGFRQIAVTIERERVMLPAGEA